MKVLVSCGVFKAKDKGVECLPRKNLESVFDELFVARKCGTFEDLVPTIRSIVEQWVSDMAHVGTDLVGTSRFENALNKSHITETFKNIPMSDSVFARLLVIGEQWVVWEDLHNTTIFRRTTQVT